MLLPALTDTGIQLYQQSAESMACSAADILEHKSCYIQPILPALDTRDKCDAAAAWATAVEQGGCKLANSEMELECTCNEITIKEVSVLPFCQSASTPH
jgi:hypothetical protein